MNFSKTMKYKKRINKNTGNELYLLQEIGERFLDAPQVYGVGQLALDLAHGVERLAADLRLHYTGK
jgi:hypothetical protein